MVVGAPLIISGGCATKRETGAAVGAAGGGLIGAAVGGETGALVGAAIGGIGGYAVGTEMERQDELRVARALETNRPMRWENPHTGYEYQIEPKRTVYEQGRECREFRMLAELNSRPEEMYGTACRAPDGKWEVISG